MWSTETVFGTIVVRERVTWDASVTLTQPITPLWAVYHGVRAARFAEEAAAIEVSSSRRTQVRDAVVGYYRVLQARAALETAERSVEQLEAQLERLRAVVEVGAAAPSEALRLEVAVAAAQQAALRAQSDLDLARAALAFAVGGEPGSMVEAAPLEAEVLPPATMELEEATTSALAHRDELAQLGLSVQQAEIGVLAKEADYLPQVVGLAQYKHAEGSGLAAADDGFVGASLSWTLWQWGARARAVDVAEARVLQLEATQELTRRQIALQVRAAWQNVRTSVASHAVAAAALEQATEAFRIERARYEAGASTATDLLDVQAALIEAENNLNASLYQAWVNYAELSYTTGAPLGGLGEEQ